MFSLLLIKIIWHAPLLLIWLASFIGLVRYQNLTFAQRYLALLVWFDLVAETTSIVYYYLNQRNLFLTPFVTIGETGLLLLLYSRVLRSKILQLIAPWLFGALIVYAILHHRSTTGTLDFWPTLRILCNLIGIGLASLYFRRLMNDLNVEHLGRDPMFLVSVGLMLYALGALLITLFSNYAFKNFSPALNAEIWRIHTFLNIMLYLCYCLALWVRPSKQSS